MSTLPNRCSSCDAALNPGDATCASCGVPVAGRKKSRLALWIVLGGVGCLVSIVVIGLLATLFMPRIHESLLRAQSTKARAQIQTLYEAVRKHAFTHGGANPRALDELLLPDDHGVAPLDRASDLFDPWGRPFSYAADTGRIWSLGADGIDGTEDDVVAEGGR